MNESGYAGRLNQGNVGSLYRCEENWILNGKISIYLYPVDVLSDIFSYPGWYWVKGGGGGGGGMNKILRTNIFNILKMRVWFGHLFFVRVEIFTCWMMPDSSSGKCFPGKFWDIIELKLLRVRMPVSNSVRWQYLTKWGKGGSIMDGFMVLLVRFTTQIEIWVQPSQTSQSIFYDFANLFCSLIDQMIMFISINKLELKMSQKSPLEQVFTLVFAKILCFSPTFQTSKSPEIPFDLDAPPIYPATQPWICRTQQNSLNFEINQWHWYCQSGATAPCHCVAPQKHCRSKSTKYVDEINCWNR